MKTEYEVLCNIKLKPIIKEGDLFFLESLIKVLLTTLRN